MGGPGEGNGVHHIGVERQRIINLLVRVDKITCSSSGMSESWVTCIKVSCFEHQACTECEPGMESAKPNVRDEHE